MVLAREDAQFITWEHPLIRNGLDLILSGDTGSSTISLLKNKALPVGTLLVELIYVVEAQAPKQLQLNRFLPPTPVRMLLDKNGNNLAAQVEFETFNRQSTRPPVTPAANWLTPCSRMFTLSFSWVKRRSYLPYRLMPHVTSHENCLPSCLVWKRCAQ